MNRLPIGLRLRARTADRFAEIVVVLVLLAAIGGWLTIMTHVTPGTTIEERSELVYRSDARFEYRATVSEPNPVYPTGMVLTNRSVYLPRLAPVLNATFVYRYDTPHDTPLAVTPELTLVLHAVDRREETTREFWRTSRSLVAPSRTTVAPGTRLERRVEVNVSAIHRELETIEESVGVVPGQMEALLVARVHERGTIGRVRVDRTSRRALRLEFSRNTYTISRTGDAQPAVRATTRVPRPTTYGPMRRWGSVGLLVVSGFGLAGVLGTRLTGRLALSDRERTRFEATKVRTAYDDWFTIGRVPARGRDGPVVQVDSLRELLDVAVHTDRRVLEDPESGIYQVITDGQTYEFRPDGDAAQGNPR